MHTLRRGNQRNNVFANEFLWRPGLLNIKQAATPLATVDADKPPVGKPVYRAD